MRLSSYMHRMCYNSAVEEGRGVQEISNKNESAASDSGWWRWAGPEKRKKHLRGVKSERVEQSARAIMRDLAST